MLLALLYSVFMSELFAASGFLFLRVLATPIDTFRNAGSIVLLSTMNLRVRIPLRLLARSEHAGHLVYKTFLLLNLFITHVYSLLISIGPYKKLLLRTILITFFFIQTGWEQYEWVEVEE